jgi:glucose uptake protein
METLLLGLATVFAWGTWLAPSQAVAFASDRVRAFYVALANLVLSAGVFFVHAPGFLDGLDLVASLGAGVFWSISSWAAFGATRKIGVAGAMGIWAPINILTACLLGALFFDEFSALGPVGGLLLGLALALIIAGILLIIRSRERRGASIEPGCSGVILAVLAGLMWGSYFIPLQLTGQGLAAAVFPMSMGIFFGALLGLLPRFGDLRLPRMRDYPLALSSGLLWGVGNYSSLALMAAIGTGRGFTIAQLCIVVNALVGIHVLRSPQPGSAAAKKIFVGVVLATFGGIVLGSLR